MLTTETLLEAVSALVFKRVRLHRRDLPIAAAIQDLRAELSRRQARGTPISSGCHPTGHRTGAYPDLAERR